MEDKGDVAFVKHTTVQDVIDSNPDWASGVSKSNYRLLCKNGGSRGVDNFEECNLAKVNFCETFYGKTLSASGYKSFQ